MPYSLDTSALIDCWERNYPQDIFPTLWQKLDEMIERGELLLSEELLEELDRKSTGLYDWVRARDYLICPTDEDIQASVTEILATFPRMTELIKNRSMGDPWVIAVAKVKVCTVVSGEKSSGQNDKPRIPNVCAHFGIKCIKTVDLLREQGWSF